MKKKIIENNLITNEFLTIAMVLILCFVVVMVDGKIDDSFKEILLVVIGFIARGALNNPKSKDDDYNNPYYGGLDEGEYYIQKSRKKRLPSEDYSDLDLPDLSTERKDDDNLLDKI